jgi:hypothetical protein
VISGFAASHMSTLKIRKGPMNFQAPGKTKPRRHAMGRGDRGLRTINYRSDRVMSKIHAPALVERFVSVERLAPYRRVCSGDPALAVALYEWNVDASAAFWRTLSQTEIVVRNAMSSRLADWSEARYSDAGWYRDHGRLLTPDARDDIAQAVRRATNDGHPESIGGVVSQLTLGFWRYLLAGRYERTLWQWCLHQAFPGARRRRRAVLEPMVRLHLLRNRIAHHEPISALDLSALRDDALAVVGMVDPRARQWIGDRCQVPMLLAVRPVGTVATVVSPSPAAVPAARPAVP